MNDATGDSYDPEVAAYFTLDDASTADFARLEELLLSLPVARSHERWHNPFCDEAVSISDTSDGIVEKLRRLLKRSYYTDAFKHGPRQNVRHVVGPHPPLNDGIEITTIIRSENQLGRVCLCSVIKRESFNVWKLYDNHSEA